MLLQFLLLSGEISAVEVAVNGLVVHSYGVAQRLPEPGLGRRRMRPLENAAPAEPSAQPQKVWVLQHGLQQQQHNHILVLLQKPLVSQEDGQLEGAAVHVALGQDEDGFAAVLDALRQTVQNGRPRNPVPFLQANRQESLALFLQLHPQVIEHPVRHLQHQHSLNWTESRWITTLSSSVELLSSGLNWLMNFTSLLNWPESTMSWIMTPR